MLKIDIWSNLFVKCYSLVLIFILLSTHLMAQDETQNFMGKMRAIQGQNYTNGELVEFELKTELSFEKLKKFQHDFIHERIYVLSITEQTSGSYIVEAFVANPTEGQQKKSFPFELDSGINLEFDASRVEKNFQLFEEKYNKVVTPYFAYLISFLFLGIILLFYFKTRPDRILKKKLREMRRKKALQLFEFFQNAKSREELEVLFKKRREISNYLEIDNEYKKFLNELNKIQYKKDWSDEEYTRLLSAKKKISEVRPKYGI